MLALAFAAFVVAWWLGLYLLARGTGRPAVYRTGWGLLAYALALAMAPFDGVWVSRAHEVLAGLPALIWTGVLVALLPAEHTFRGGAERLWRLVVLPVGAAVLVLAAVAGDGWRIAGTAVVLAPLFAALIVLVRQRGGWSLRDGLVVIATLFFGLGVALLLVPFGLVPDGLVLGAIGVDLAVLGVVVAVSSAVDAGETVRTDMPRSAIGAGAAALVLGGQVGLAGVATGGSDALPPLLFAVTATAVAGVTLASNLQAALDRLTFAASPDVRLQRSELRDAADALPRKAEHQRLAELDDDAFARLVREALRHYGDLGKLVSSPLTHLPVVDKRLAERGRPDHSLDRAAELKAVLLESIERLRPPDVEFGTSDEWRHYNALYFPYVMGLRPYRRQPDLSGMTETSRRAFDWLRRYVPERTLYNWQNAATKVVATDLRSRGWQ